MAEALAGAGLVMVVVPSSAHVDIAKAAAPYLRDGQIVVLHPGRTLGAIEFDKTLHDHGCRADVTVAEAETFIIAGVTPSVARVLEALDRERVTVAASLGIRGRTALEWLKLAYDAEGQDLNEAIHNQPGYYGIKAPSTLNHRYMFEDVPMSLVPIAALGQHFGVSVRGMDAIIRLACIVHRTDYWRRGRTLDKLGIDRLSVSELTQFVMQGERCWEG